MLSASCTCLQARTRGCLQAQCSEKGLQANPHGMLRVRPHRAPVAGGHGGRSAPADVIWHGQAQGVLARGAKLLLP